MNIINISVIFCIPVSEDPETLDAGALAESASRWAENAARAERTRRDERSVAPRTLRRDQPSPDITLEKITKKVSMILVS